jgi:hypothetical protein
MLGLETPAKLRALSEADGMAVGAACRHAGRAIEDCYILNPTANRAAVFGGWKEMNDYMTKNKIEIVKPQVLPTGSTVSAQKAPAPGFGSSGMLDATGKTPPAAHFIPPESIKKPGGPAEKKNFTAPLAPGAPAPAQAAPQKSAAKEGQIVANVDNATVKRAKEQAHTPGSKPY